MTETALQTIQAKASDAEASDARSIMDRALFAALVGLSNNSCRVYTRYLRAMFDFLLSRRLPLSRLSVQEYLGSIRETSQYNQALSACKRLAEQAAENGWIDWATANQIRTIRTKRHYGTRAGNWLVIDQATALLQSPDDRTIAGKRDRAVIALLLSTGLRREELSRLDWSQIQIRENRHFIVDLVGKGNRVRSIAIPDWAYAILRAWGEVSGTTGRVVRSIDRHGNINGSLSASAIRDIVTKHAESTQISCAPHDLRRSFAKLARKNGAPLEVIQKSLGHSSVATTERYTNAGEEANAGDYFSL